MIPFVLLALLQTQQPQRDVKQPGVIATGQRISPAGVQTVFEGRVYGVRFGRTSDEIWVAAPHHTYRLDWRNNKTIADVPLNGAPGVFGVTVDRPTGRAFVASMGRLPVSSKTPGTVDPRQPAVTYLSAIDAAARGDSAQPLWRSHALGDYMAGAPAIAPKANANGRRYAALPLPANDALAVLDAETGAVEHTIPLGVEPIAVVIANDGRTAYVSVLGGPRPTGTQKSARQCCDLRAEAIRIDARGIASAGSVTQVDLIDGAVRKDIKAGRHPTALAWDEPGNRLYVADGNSDSVTVIDTKSGTVATSIAIAPFQSRQRGLAPTALVLSPDAKTLYVTLGGLNAVALYDVSARQAQLRGLVPTSWYPSSVDVSPDGKTLAVGSLLGIGSGESNHSSDSKTRHGKFVHAIRGAVNVFPVPTPAELSAYTTAVAQNSRLILASSPKVSDVVSTVPRAVPQRPGDPSLINHVVFIVRENRTYDQVLGDLGRGAGDTSLVIYGRDVTPNAHALSEQFVTLDHFFASGGNSADGHQWITQANETEYPMWPLYFGRSYPSEGEDAMAYSSGGFLWENAQSKKKTVTVFGEYAPSVRNSSPVVRASMLDAYMKDPTNYAAQREMMRKRYNTRSDIPSLDKVLVREYPGWTLETSDVVAAGDVLYHLGEWEKARQMPNLVMIILPSDHTVATAASWCSPRACVADNDLAMGKIVDGLSHASFWKDMAIFVVEDDAQDGVDHIDGHRTVALAISPYIKRGTVDSTFYVHPSMVKTIELMLGLPAMSIFDLVATDMRASFIDASATPDFRPYSAIQPKQSLLDKNLRTSEITGPNAAARKKAALASARMILDGPDEAPTGVMNRILWQDSRGFTAPYPEIRHTLFFPMSLDVADEDRKEKKRQRKD